MMSPCKLPPTPWLLSRMKARAHETAVACLAAQPLWAALPCLVMVNALTASVHWQ